MDGWFARGIGGHARLRRGGVTPPYKLIEKLAVEADAKHRPAGSIYRVSSIEADEDDTKTHVISSINLKHCIFCEQTLHNL